MNAICVIIVGIWAGDYLVMRIEGRTVQPVNKALKKL
jgi:hypothetical protein